MGRVTAIFTVIGAVLGFFTLVATLTSSNGAPQEAAGAAIAVAFVIIPYCFGRAVTWAAYPHQPRD